MEPPCRWHVDGWELLSAHLPGQASHIQTILQPAIVRLLHPAKPYSTIVNQADIANHVLLDFQTCHLALSYVWYALIEFYSKYNRPKIEYYQLEAIKGAQTKESTFVPKWMIFLKLSKRPLASLPVFLENVKTRLIHLTI